MHSSHSGQEQEQEEEEKEEEEDEDEGRTREGRGGEKTRTTAENEKQQNVPGHRPSVGTFQPTSRPGGPAAPAGTDGSRAPACTGGRTGWISSTAIVIATGADAPPGSKGYLECGDCGCRQSGPQELARDVGHRERLGAADSAADLSAAGRALAGRWQGERQDEQDEWNEQVKQGEQVEQAGQAEQDEQVSS